MLTEHEPTGWVSCPCPEDPNWEAGTAQYAMTKLENVSVAGVHIVLHRQPRPGMLLTIEFLRAPKNFAPPVTARVMQVRKHLRSGWLVECEFLRKLSDEELHAALTAPAPLKATC
jgi:hypothetical protein